MCSSHFEITDNELKALAHEHGYRLVKLNTREKLLPCPRCHTNRTRLQVKLKDGVSCFRCCVHCGFEGNYAKTKTESYRTWNDAVKECMKEKEQ